MTNYLSEGNTMKNTVTELLSMLKQERIINYMKTLSEDKQKDLADRIKELDLSVLDSETCDEKRGVFAPPTAITIDDIDKNRDKWTETGLKAIANHEVGAILLAGGQGSRLGFDHPKGTLNIGVNRELYIFECLINNLLEVCEKAGAVVPLFIMTSVDNKDETIQFFKKHKYFGYIEDNVWFFAQEQLPTVDENGQLMLNKDGDILTAPNGNGGWYASMEKTGMLKVLKDTNVKWLNVFAVDNVLQRIADPCFIGAVIESEYVSGAKVVAKANPTENVGVLCLEDGRPSICEYYEMTKEMKESREADGKLSYNYGVILNYLFRVDKLNETLKVKLPLHKAHKKIACLDENGEFITPDEPNAYKFETLALDMVKLQDNCLAYEVDRKREFAPIKNKEGADTVETARELLRFNGVEL